MSKIKVLIVEDEGIISEYLARQLEKSGYQITDVVESGEFALQSIEKNLPDIIIMDIELDGELDGIQTTEEINKNLKLPVIYLTKLTDKPTFKRALQTYPTSYLVKPFNEVDLINTIELTLFNASYAEKNHKIATKCKKQKLNVENATSQQKEIYDTLMQLLENDNIYLDMELTQDKLAKEIGTNRTYLSEVIKLFSGKGYVDFINEFRINHAIHLLKDPNNTNSKIEIEIAKKSGFKSNNFFEIFKASTGQTPAEFKKQCNNN